MAAYAIICCPKSVFTVTRDDEATEPNTDMVLNAADFPAGRKARILLSLNSYNDRCYFRLWDRFGAAEVAGSYFTWLETSYGVYKSAAFTLPEGLKSFQVRIWVQNPGDSVALYKISLQVESA